MINLINSAIDIVAENKSKFVNREAAFTRTRNWPFDSNVKFQIFRPRTTTRHDINTFYLYSKNHSYSRITRGNYSRRRQLIDPIFYKEVNKEYLKQIKYNQNLSIHKTYKNFYLYAIDGMTIRFDYNKKLRKDFKVKEGNLNYINPSEAKFSAIMDLLNGHIIDGELGNFRQSERELMKINVKNSMDIIDINQSILTMDRGFASLELMAWMKELNINFVQRINKEFYKAEINRIKDNDSPINIKLNASRLRGFKDSELKEKYRKESYLNLRLVTVELESGEIERLLTNIPPEIMSTEDIYHIYGLRWTIETNYNTLKNRFEIENFTSNTKENIKQDIYATVIKYNIGFNYYSICNKLVENKIRKENKEALKDYEYKVDFANLIRNLNDFLYLMIINPDKSNVSTYTSWLIYESCQEPNKIKNNRSYPIIRMGEQKKYSRSYAKV